MIPLFNTAGSPIAYADEACQALYTEKGELLACFDNELLYSPSGRYLGWVRQGWVYDRDGRPALFAANASGGPERPSPNLEEIRLPRRTRLAELPSALPQRQRRPARRLHPRSWSPFSAAAFFLQ